MFGRGSSFAGRVGSTLRGKFGRNQHKSALSAKRGNRLYQKGKNVPVEGKVNSRGACASVCGARGLAMWCSRRALRSRSLRSPTPPPRRRRRSRNTGKFIPDEKKQFTIIMPAAEEIGDAINNVRALPPSRLSLRPLTNAACAPSRCPPPPPASRAAQTVRRTRHAAGVKYHTDECYSNKFQMHVVSQRKRTCVRPASALAVRRRGVASRALTSPSLLPRPPASPRRCSQTAGAASARPSGCARPPRV